MGSLYICNSCVFCFRLISIIGQICIEELGLPHSDILTIGRISSTVNTGCFLHWASPKKYRKPRLGESMLTYIVLDTPKPSLD